MPRLVSLNLSHNRLSRLPKLDKNSNLARLDLSYNRFNQVPFTLVKCPSLTYLNLSYNEISRLPEWLASVGNLEDVRLEGVPLLKPSDNKDFQKTKQLLKVKLDNASRVNEIKVVVAGTCKNGKAEFVSSICNDECEKDNAHATVKERKEFVKTSFCSGSNEHGAYEFNIWEIIGLNSDSTVPIERLLYTKCSIYVLVFDAIIAEAEIGKLWVWLDAISTHASPSCVLFVAFESQPIMAEIEKLLVPLVKHFSNFLIFCEPFVFSLSKTNTYKQSKVIIDAIHQTSLLLEWTDGQPYMGRLVRNTAVAFKHEFDLLKKSGSLAPAMLLEGMETFTSHFKNFQIREPKEIAKICSFLNDVGQLRSFYPTCDVVSPFSFMCICDMDLFMNVAYSVFADVSNEADTHITSTIQASVSVSESTIHQKLQSCSSFTSALNKPCSSNNIALIIKGIASILTGYQLLSPIKIDSIIKCYLPLFHLSDFPSDNISDLLPGESSCLNVRWIYSCKPFLSQRKWVGILDAVLNQVVIDNDIAFRVWKNSFVFPEYDLAVVLRERQSVLMVSNRFTKFFKQVKHVISAALPEAIVSILCPMCLKSNVSAPAEVCIHDCIKCIKENKDCITCKYNHKISVKEIVPHLIVSPDSLIISSPTWHENCTHVKLEQLDTLQKCLMPLTSESNYEHVHDKGVLLREFSYPSLSSSEGLLIKLSYQINRLPQLCVLSFIPNSLGTFLQLSSRSDICISSIIVYRIALQLAYAIDVSPCLSKDLNNVLFWSFDPESAFNCSFVVDKIHEPRVFTSKKRLVCWKFYVGHLLEKCKEAVLKLSCNTFMASYCVLEEILNSKKSVTLNQIICSLSKVETQLLSRMLTTSDNEYNLTTALHVTRLCANEKNLDEKRIPKNEIWMPMHSKSTNQMKIGILKPTSSSIKFYPVHSFNPTAIIAVTVCSRGSVWVSSLLEDGLSCLTIFDVNSRSAVHNIKMKNNAFTCLTEYRARDRMYLGTKAGFVFDFSCDVEQLKANGYKPRHKRVNGTKVISLIVINDSLWVSTADNSIYLLRCSWDIGAPKLKEFFISQLTQELVLGKLIPSQDGKIVYSFAEKGQRISLLNIVAKDRSESIAYYNDSRNHIAIDEIAKSLELSVNTFVTALVESNGCLWVGLSTGYILIFHRNKLLYHMQPYTGHVTSLCSLQYTLNGSNELCVLSSGKEINSCFQTKLTVITDESCDVLMLWTAPNVKVLSQMVLIEKSCGNYLQSYQALASMIRMGEFSDVIPLKLVKGCLMHTSIHVNKASVTLSPGYTLQVILEANEIINLSFSVRPTFQTLVAEIVKVSMHLEGSLELGYRLEEHKMLVSLSNDNELNCYLQLPSKPPLLIL